MHFESRFRIATAPLYVVRPGLRAAERTDGEGGSGMLTVLLGVWLLTCKYAELYGIQGAAYR